MTDIEMPFSSLDPAIAKALTDRGFTALTPVQRAMIDPGLDGRDLRITSQTGSGKTIAIGLTLLEAIRDAKGPPRALVIAPTRELAKQVNDELSWLYASVPAAVAAVTGGTSFREEMRSLGRKPAVVVGTPGRMLDHLRRGTVDPSAVRAVVLDEADRMLDLGFRDDLEAIFSLVPEGRRTHLVSATFPREVLALADKVQHEPARVEGTPLGTANTDIEHVLHLVPEDERFDAIVNLLLATPNAETLIFARTRVDVASLADGLRDAGFVVGTLSGEMDQPERERALATFKRGHLDALVATDVAARGIDVSDIGRVIHADPPQDADAYTHRSGRTGRAGRKGTSSVLVTEGTFERTQRVLSRAKLRFRVEPVPSQEEIRALRDDMVLASLAREPASGDDAPADPGPHLLALAERVLGLPNVALAIARLLARARAAGPAEPRELTPVVLRASTSARGPRASHRRADEAEPAPRRRDEERSWAPFRIAWGAAHGADARRLLAMVCRRGNIRSNDIGAIRVQRNYSIVDVAAELADGFERATRVPDPRDPRATIRREGREPAAPERAPVKEARPRPPKAAPSRGGARPPTRPAGRAGPPPRPLKGRRG